MTNWAQAEWRFKSPARCQGSKRPPLPWAGDASLGCPRVEGRGKRRTFSPRANCSFMHTLDGAEMDKGGGAFPLSQTVQNKKHLAVL